MKKVIGVMGKGDGASNKEKELAYKVGGLVAQSGAVLLTGGMQGIMEGASRGASEQGGLVIAICPTYDKKDLNYYVDIPIVTGMRGGRNYMNILSSDIIVAIGNTSAGTLSEIAFAIQAQKHIYILASSQEMRAYLITFNCPTLHFIDTLEDLETIFKQ